MTGVSVPMSWEDSENLNRPLTGTEDLKNSSAYLQAEKSSAENKRKSTRTQRENFQACTFPQPVFQNA